MNNLTEKLVQDFKPTLAIVVYESSSKDAYLESHRIHDDGSLLEGKPLAQETLDAIVDVFFDERQNRVKVSGLVPDNLLHYEVMPGGQIRVVWYRPAEQRPIYFAEKLHIPSGMAMVPPMIYEVTKRHLSVYSFTENIRPVEETRLYRGPFHNVDDQGNVCLGSAKVPKPKVQTYSNIMKYWEDMFWMSEFTHLTGKNPVKGNVNLIWTDQVQHPDKPFPIDVLIPLEPQKKAFTLKDLLS